MEQKEYELICERKKQYDIITKDIIDLREIKDTIGSAYQEHILFFREAEKTSGETFKILDPDPSQGILRGKTRQNFTKKFIALIDEAIKEKETERDQI